jgi:hypothetical protein
MGLTVLAIVATQTLGGDPEPARPACGTCADSNARAGQCAQANDCAAKGCTAGGGAAPCQTGVVRFMTGLFPDCPLCFLWLNSLEYQVPVVASDRIYLVGFVDSGTVERNVELTNYRVTAGAGLRIQIPMLGPVPVALDFGFPIVKGPEDRAACERLIARHEQQCEGASCSAASACPACKSGAAAGSDCCEAKADGCAAKPCPACADARLYAELVAIIKETNSPDAFMVAVTGLAATEDHGRKAIPVVIRNAERIGVLKGIAKYP